jgi:hypothetical protein
LNSPLRVGKDDCLLKISQDNLVEVLLRSIHSEWITSSIHTVSGHDGIWFLPAWHNPIPCSLP